MPLESGLGTYRTTLSTVRSTSGVGIEESTRLGVIIHAIELDEGHPSDFREQRFQVWSRSIERGLNFQGLRAGVIPDRDFIGRLHGSILVRYLGPWEGWPWGDPDDDLARDSQVVSLADLIAEPRIERTLTFTGSRGRYTATVVFQSNSRSNPICSIPITDELFVAPDRLDTAGNDFWVMKFDRSSPQWGHMSPIAGHAFGSRPELRCGRGTAHGLPG